MKKKWFVLGFVLILLLVSGASKCQTGKKTVAGSRYIGGTDGLVTSFVEGEPADSVLDANNEKFSISLFLENKGESNIDTNGVRTTITGISQKAFSIASLTKTNENLMDGKRKDGTTTLKGGEDYISYDANYKDDLPTDFITNIRVNYCYNYKTRAVADVCLRKDVAARIKETDACKVVEEKVVSSSSAPIQITALSERVSKTNEVAVTFTIENKGKGDVYNIGSFISGDCVEAQERLNKDYVYVKLSSQEGLSIKCTKFSDKAEGKVRLVQGLTNVMCRIDTSSLQSTSYVSPLDITVEYIYKDFISKSLKVENAI